MIRDYSPILVGKVAPAPTHIPAPAPTEKLEPPRALPDFSAMDDCGAYAVESKLLATLIQLCFVIRTEGDLMAACEGAEKVISNCMGANHG